MTVRTSVAVFAAVAMLLLGAGCGGNGGTVGGDETNDALYQQAQDLKKQGRYNEALNAFLKEIDRRGENGAPESHLEAGTLCLNWAHDPIEAVHHFSKYLELQPTGPRATIVKGQRDAARRAILVSLRIPVDGQGGMSDRSEEVAQLQRTIDELRAENQALRGASPAPASQFRPAPMISLSDESPAPATSGEAPVIPVPAAQPYATSDSTFTANLSAPRPAPPPGRAAGAVTRPTVGRSSGGGAPLHVTPVASTPTRPTAPQRPGTTAGTAGRRSHTVAGGEKSLWSIARQYYGSVNQAKVTALFEANRDVMRTPNDLKAGMVLRIP